MKTFFLFLLLACAIPTSAQTGESGGANISDRNSAQMLMPPPITNANFPGTVGAEQESNYLSGSLMFNGGYVNNLYPGTGSPVNESIYTVAPTIAEEIGTDRSHEALSYSSSFTFYEPNSTLNTIDQSGSGTLQYRWSPHTNFLAGDTVVKTSNTWNQPLTSAGISGALPSVTPGIFVPFAPQLSNSAYAEMGWQLSKDDMIGAGGVSTLVKFSNTFEAQGLYNSNSQGASGFYTHRLTERQYAGAAIQYSKIFATPATSTGIGEADLTSENVLGFYTMYLSPTISISIGAGSQHFTVSQAPLVPATGWTPSAIASLSWQGLHTSVAVSLSHFVTEGAGIIGAYDSSSVNASGQWQVSRSTTFSFGGGYANITNMEPQFIGSIPGGHTLSGTASMARKLGPFATLTVQYVRLHQTYSGIPAILSDPNSFTASGALAYHFSLPLGQ